MSCTVNFYKLKTEGKMAITFNYSFKLVTCNSCSLMQSNVESLIGSIGSATEDLAWSRHLFFK